MDTEYGGYAGKVLKIDLTSKTTSIYPWSESERQLYLGGKIMAAKILFDNMDKDVKPFSSENMLVISTGPFTNTYAPSSSRFNISSISPLTNLIASSNCGGDFGMYLKKAGYDALIIIGKSEERIWIEINEEEIIFNSANDIWGLDTYEVQERLPKKTGKIVIGPAGENLIKYAGIFSQERTAGRAGLGSVMGYKNLKGIVARGKKKTFINNKEKTKELYKKWIYSLKKHPLTGTQLPKYGTAGLLKIMQSKNVLATKNFSKGNFDDYEMISGELLKEKYLVKNKGCITCPIQCGRQVEIDGKKVKGPELETLGLLGANIENNDIEKIIEWNYQLDKLGMDTISTAGSIAFAMELNEKGLWDNGLEFGKNDNLDKVFNDIANRNGIGDDLANGVKFLSEKYGGKEFAIHSKGMELSAYEPRASVGQGLGYAVSNRGGCHLGAGYVILFEAIYMNMDPYSKVSKPELTMLNQDIMEVCSAAGICLFTLQTMIPEFIVNKPDSLVTNVSNKIMTKNITSFTLKKVNKISGKGVPINIPSIPHIKALESLTGFKMNFGIFRTIGERGYILERMFNIKRGLKYTDDSLPKRLTHELQDESNKNSRVPLEDLREEYYKCRGLTEKGEVTNKILKRLNMEEYCI
jgi:aldehyde:ferredoxin oxidoreductase